MARIMTNKGAVGLHSCPLSSLNHLSVSIHVFKLLSVLMLLHNTIWRTLQLLVNRQQYQAITLGVFYTWRPQNLAESSMKPTLNCSKGKATCCPKCFLWNCSSNPATASGGFSGGWGNWGTSKGQESTLGRRANERRHECRQSGRGRWFAPSWKFCLFLCALRNSVLSPRRKAPIQFPHQPPILTFSCLVSCLSVLWRNAAWNWQEETLKAIATWQNTEKSPPRLIFVIYCIEPSTSCWWNRWFTQHHLANTLFCQENSLHRILFSSFVAACLWKQSTQKLWIISQ